MEELVSVIVPVYNIEEYLPRCLACLEMQTYKNLEIILVDDGSTDGSGKICDEYAAKDSRVRVIHQSNKGLWAARNTGQDAAQGEYLWFPDGDDYFHKDIIRLMYEAINQNIKYDLVIVGYKQTVRFDEDIDSDVVLQTCDLSVDDLFNSIVWYKSNVWYKSKVLASTMWNKFFRRSLLKDIYSRDFKYAQDRDFGLRLFLKEPKTTFVDNVLYWWVQRSSSAMHQSDYIFVRAKCETQFTFKTFTSLQGNEIRYRRYFLDNIYKWLPLYLELSSKTEDTAIVRNEGREILKKTWKQYLLYSDRTIYKRLRRLLRITIDVIRI